MITRQILKQEDDPTRRNRGSAKDQDNATRELVKGRRVGIIGASKNSPQGNRRSVPANPAGSIPRPRHKHRQDFIQLAEYLLEGEPDLDGERPHKDGEGRVDISGSINCIYSDHKHLTAEQFREVANWMGETAALNTRARKAASFHYVVSLPEKDNNKSTPEFWSTTAERMLDVLGMSEHQALYVVHGDTDNKHMHLMVNRVHPTKCTVADPLRGLIALEALNRQLEKDFNLEVEPGRHIDPETGKTYDWERVKKGEIHVPKNRARKSRVEMEKFARQVKKDLADKPFTTLNSWAELETRLAKDGYHLQASGRGMKLCDDQGNEAKLTKIAGAGNGREKLEYRFDCDWTFYVEAKSKGMSIQELIEANIQSFQDQSLKAESSKIDPLAAFRSPPPVINWDEFREAEKDKPQNDDDEIRIDPDQQAAKEAEERTATLRLKADALVGRPVTVRDISFLPDAKNEKIKRISNDIDHDQVFEVMKPHERVETLEATQAALERIETKLEASKDHQTHFDLQTIANELKSTLKRYASFLDADSKYEAAKTAPILFDDEGLANWNTNPEKKAGAQERLKEIHLKLGQMTHAEVRAVLIETQNEKKCPPRAAETPQEDGKRKLLLIGGEWAIKNYMKTNNIPLPERPKSFSKKIDRGGR